MNRKIEKINVFIFVAVFLTIVFIPSYAQQYGNLVVRVVECGCRNPIENARVEVVGVNDPTSYTNSQGYAYFYNLPIGQYLITVSKEGYKLVPKYTTIECSKTTFEEICLEKIKVCNPGEIRNRRCACSTQVAYEICKSDGTGWETVIENCPSGYVCESGLCQMKEVNCMVKIEVKDASNNYPISNALLCYNSKCYFTDYSGIASFYVSKGVYAITISKEDYNSKTIYISCEYGKDVRQTIYLDKKIKLVSCDSLDGWYYTPQTYCETGNAECGGGIMLRKEEFRDYFGFASDISQCKDYRIISIRWKEEGLCRKECGEGYECSEGFCRKIEKREITFNGNEYNKVYIEGKISQEETNSLIWIFLLLPIIFLLLSFFLRNNRREETMIDCIKKPFINIASN